MASLREEGIGALGTHKGNSVWPVLSTLSAHLVVHCTSGHARRRTVSLAIRPCATSSARPWGQGLAGRFSAFLAPYALAPSTTVGHIEGLWLC